MLSWQPAGIKTKLTDAFDPDQKVGGGLISATTAVNDMFKQLGKESAAIGNWRHAAQMSLAMSLPAKVINGHSMTHFEKVANERR